MHRKLEGSVNQRALNPTLVGVIPRRLCICSQQIGRSDSRNGSRDSGQQPRLNLDEHAPQLLKVTLNAGAQRLTTLP